MLSDARLQSEACLGKATSVFLVAFVSFLLSIIMICLAKSRAVFFACSVAYHSTFQIWCLSLRATQQVVAPFPHTHNKESESKKERGK